MEPSSPPTSELFSISESTGNWIYNDNFADGITFITNGDIELKSELEVSNNIADCAEFIVELCEIKDDNWHSGAGQPIASEPLDYPIDSVIITHPNAITKVHNPIVDIVGDCSLHNLNATVFTQLTPPHSPPQNDGETSTLSTSVDIHFNGIPQHQPSTILHHQSAAQTPIVTPISSTALATTSASVEINDTSINSPSTLSPNASNPSFFSWSANIADAHVPEINDQKMSEMIDEFVNKRAKELSQWIQQCSDASSCSVLSTTDEEWQNDSSTLSSASSSPVPKHFTTIDDELGLKSNNYNSSVSTKKRTRPYGRGIEDRKIRKKEQNKNAATRYRQKKKLEMEVVLTEEQKLEQRNQDLKRKLSECQREAKYLRRLIREFYQKMT